MQLPKRRSQTLKQRDDSEDTVFLTPEGIRRLKDTLRYLEKEERPKIVEDLSFALTLGDFSENAEYQDAKARMARIDGRIFSIKDRLRRTSEIDGTSDGHAHLGSTVVLDIGGKKKTYQIVGPQETNPAQGRISHLSPLGQALLGQRAGDIIRVKTDAGENTYTLVEVRASAFR